METKETQELVVFTAQSAVEIFTKGGLAAILADIERKVRSMDLDASTPNGRSEIRSVAHQIARTKVALDSEGKKLTEGWRDATKRVNEERKKATEKLDALGEEIRRPLTEFEEKEKSRVEGHETAIGDIVTFHTGALADPYLSAENLQKMRCLVVAAHANRTWEEFGKRAESTRTGVLAWFDKAITKREEFEAKEAELKRLREEEQARLQAERDEKLRQEAALKATREAERKAAEKAESVRIDAERKSRAAEEALRREEELKRDFEQRAIRAERAKQEAEKKAAQDLAEAKARAEREQKEAVAKERARKEAEEKAQEAARVKRQKDEEHVRRIKKEIVADFVACTCYEDVAIDIMKMIVSGKIRHVSVKY